MKIAFIGGVKFSYEILKTILENGWSVSLLFTYDNSKKPIYSDFSNFDELTKKYNLFHVKVSNINDQKNVEILQKIKPDLILVMGWSQLLKNEIISIPRIGIVGSHPTELPKYRGRAPIPWTIIKKLPNSALTFFWIEKGVDNGDILNQEIFDIDEADDATSVYEKIIIHGKKMILKSLSDIQKNKIIKIKQTESKFIEYWEKRIPEDGKIIWENSGKEILQLIKASTHPYPGAFTKYKDSKLLIWKANFLDEISVEPGLIMDVSKDGVKVGTGNGIILLKTVSFEGDIEKNSQNYFSIHDKGVILG